ncbi:MAG: GCN5-like N-acetyltransferase [Bacillus sp. (in: firmicutes)]|jgi:ribosomal protein S18 acetylase RimI-like enzyme|nr:GCN5-like N-acetyltransferase [Bacillus sp. (in: firmicutes)]
MEIVLIRLKELSEVNKFYSCIASDLRKKGIDQWVHYYPNHFIVKEDLKRETLFGIKETNKLVGAIVLDTNQSKKYIEIQWEDFGGSPIVIHRLAVDPLHQGKGYGKKLLQFAEEYAWDRGHTSIRFDVYSENHRAIAISEKFGYQEKGEIRYLFRKASYKCFEKLF